MNPSFQQWAGDRRLKGLVLLVLALAAVALLSYTYFTIKQGKYVNTYGPTTISVRGVGEVTQKPDIATFSFGVHAEAPDPASAQKRASDLENTVLAYLKENGVEEKDTKTLNYNLSPKYEYPNVMCTANYCPPTVGNPKIVGYTIDETVQVKVRDTNKAGTLLAGVGETGATDISGLAFTIDDDTKAKDEAREKAVADAKEKAQVLAGALGVRLGRLSSFYEEEGGGPYPMYGKAYNMDEVMSASAPPVPQAPTGENTITSAVNLTYEIR